MKCNQKLTFQKNLQGETKNHFPQKHSKQTLSNMKVKEAL